MVFHPECPSIDFVPVDWRGAKTPEAWAALVLAKRDELLGQAPEALQQA